VVFFSQTVLVSVRFQEGTLGSGCPGRPW
jgi:hypothetical protein